MTKLCTRSSCLTILNYPRETISRRCCEASGRGGVSPNVLGRSTGAVQLGSEWCQSRIKCHLAVQTAVAFKKIRYVSDSVPHLKVTWFRFENVKFNATCAVHTAKSKSDMGHIWAKKSDSGHLQLQCDRSHRDTVQDVQMPVCVQFWLTKTLNINVWFIFNVPG